LGEGLGLRIKDVDVGSGVLFVAESKGRSRWVPFHPSLRREIKLYLRARHAFAPAGPDDPFFVGVRRKLRLSQGAANGVLTRLLREAGFKPDSGRVGPRVHDLRHTFAVHRLIRWYRRGIDVEGRLPWLSAYMGHANILGTETYLTATPELLAIVARRFRRWFLRARRFV
jgi:integrase